MQLLPQRISLLGNLWVAAYLFAAAPATQATTPTSGLWVGEATLTRVNETVVGINAAGQTVAPDPSVTTPVKSSAHLRVIFHVDSQGQVRLLKAVAVVATSNTPPEVLITNPALYPNYGALNTIGRRIASAAFDFGDFNAVQAVNQVAAAAGAAVATNGNAFTASQAAVNAAATAPPGASSGYLPFVSSAVFQSSANLAANAANAAALQLTGATSSQIQSAANAAALKALTDGQVLAAADGVVATEALMTGTLGAGQTITGNIYVGASHPTNPFRHRRHPDHTVGYPVTRTITVQFDALSSTNAYLTVGFGVDQVTGTYREQIMGIHKPLGPNQNIGLITDGTIVLNRISKKDTLNQ